MDYSAMKMEDLRREGRAAGFSSKFVTFAAKKDLVLALENGKEPIAYNASTGDDLADILANALQGKIKSGIDEGAVRDIVKNEIAGLSMPVRLEITNTTGAVTVTGNCHFRLKEIITLANIREDLLLVGPAGSGKTHACHMAADALNLPFYFTSVGQQTTKSDLMGYMSATGTYVSTLLRRAYEHGGVFLLDEIDADVAAARAYARNELRNDPTLIEAGRAALRLRAMTERNYRQSRGHSDWQIEIIGDMPEQIGMCRYR